MKGLLLKDYYMIIKYCKAFIFVLALFLLISCFEDSNMFFMFYPILIAGLIPITLISYDEREKWSTYSLTLPYDKNEIVISKYLVGLILEMLVFILIAVVQGVRLAYTGAFIMNDYLSLLSIVFGMGLIGPSILMPFIFKFGAEKGRIAYYIVIGLLCVCGTILAGSGITIKTNLEYLWILVVIVSLLVYFASLLISIKFYQKKEI